jgi:hypothetical protein
VDTVMRFGMGILLTSDEEEILAPIVRPCFAALGLANDYYSFDIEYKEFKESQRVEGSHTMTNAVWLYMNWNNLSIDEAKAKVVQVLRGFEKDFQQSANYFIADTKRCRLQLREYLRSLAFQIPGNIVWSLRCPRYHPELCSEASNLLHPGNEQDQNQNSQDPLLPAAKQELSDDEGSDTNSSISSSSILGTSKPAPSSRSSVNLMDDSTNEPKTQSRAQLGSEVGHPFQARYLLYTLILGISSICLPLTNTPALFLPRGSVRLSLMP